jgi:alpha-L-fucosidase
MKHGLLVVAVAAWWIAGIPVQAMEGDPYFGETAEQRDARMAWWREAKFGMFIHWGVYAVPAGTHDGRKIGGIGEWIMLRGRIPVESYKGYAEGFNPVKYDPGAWADLAAEAGMRYLVITAKHHDGFALFPSEASNWDVVDATPWKKDLIGPLAEASRARGLKFGLYYSQAQDWVHPGGAKAGMKEGEGWDEAHKGPFDPYLENVAAPQVREILTRYQPDVLWWDTPIWMNTRRAAKLAPLLALRPGIIHNNRLGGAYPGDTETPEQRIPDRGYPGRDWETCMTMNDTWGFKSDDQNWKSASQLIRNLVDIASKGGNYLLNVGPTAEGEIPAESVRLLKEVGAWMKAHGESIYGSQASPLRKLPWGRCTAKTDGDSTVIYLHVFDWPADSRLTVPGLVQPVQSAELLAGGGPLAFEPRPDGIVLTLPATAPDAICPVIKLRVKGRPEMVQAPVIADPDGVIRLLPEDASLSGNTLKIEEQGEQSHIGFWTNPEDSVSWKLRAGHEGSYLVQIESAAPAGGAVVLVQGIGKLAYSVPQTESYRSFTTTKVGEITLHKGADLTLTLRPLVDGWKPVNIRKVELIPRP